MGCHLGCLLPRRRSEASMVTSAEADDHDDTCIEKGFSCRGGVPLRGLIARPAFGESAFADEARPRWLVTSLVILMLAATGQKDCWACPGARSVPEGVEAVVHRRAYAAAAVSSRGQVHTGHGCGQGAAGRGRQSGGAADNRFLHGQPLRGAAGDGNQVVRQGAGSPRCWASRRSALTSPAKLARPAFWSWSPRRWARSSPTRGPPACVLQSRTTARRPTTPLS